VIPDLHSCAGDNISPALEWVNPPPGTMSFALRFTDLSTDFEHSAIWDIPAGVSSLPEDVDKTAMPSDVPGASQAESYAGWNGYAGPCPGEMHTYGWTLYALDVAMLAEIDTNSSLNEAQAAFEAHMIESATLTGTFTPP
jgi:Raf kinase inhibitor-like YbhB/YbcL family protein